MINQRYKITFLQNLSIVLNKLIAFFFIEIIPFFNSTFTKLKRFETLPVIVIDKIRVMVLLTLAF